MLNVKKTIGIIGCGLIADLHVETIKGTIPDYSITVCDTSPGKAELLKKKYNLKNSYDSVEEMLTKEKLYSVHILSPPHLHVSHALKCLESGSHVLVEKPLTFNVSDIHILENMAKLSKKVICVDHSLLYQPCVIKVLEMLRKVDIEKILYVRSFFGMDTDVVDFTHICEGHWKSRLPGGTLIDTIIHPITLAVELTGKPKNITIAHIDSQEQPKEITVFWKGTNGQCNITVSSLAKPFRRMTEIITTKKTYYIDHSTETTVVLNEGYGPKSIRKAIKNLGFSYQLTNGTIRTAVKVLRGKLKENPGARSLINVFYRHLINGEKAPVKFDNIRNATFALEKITEMIDKNKKLKNYINNPNKKTAEIVYKQEQRTKHLVTGASGFLGKNVCDILSQTNRYISGQVRRGPKADKLYDKKIKKVFVDFSYKAIDYQKLINNVNEVVHCAHSFSANTWNEFKRTNVDATISLFEAAKDAGCEKFIFISSVAVYGVHKRGSFTVNESNNVIMGNSKWDFYIKSKTLTEKLLLEKANSNGTKLLILRPGILYSADSSRLTKKSIETVNLRLLIIFGNSQKPPSISKV